MLKALTFASALLMASWVNAADIKPFGINPETGVGSMSQYCDLVSDNAPLRVLQCGSINLPKPHPSFEQVILTYWVRMPSGLLDPSSILCSVEARSKAINDDNKATKTLEIFGKVQEQLTIKYNHPIEDVVPFLPFPTDNKKNLINGSVKMHLRWLEDTPITLDVVPNGEDQLQVVLFYKMPGFATCERAVIDAEKDAL